MPEPNQPDLAQLQQRLAAIESRLQRLEAEREVWTGAFSVNLPQVQPVHQQAPLAILVPHPTVSMNPVPAAPASPSPEIGETWGAELAKESLERTVGLKVAGWVGAIVLVVGVGLGIQYAHEQGWLRRLPVAIQLGLMSLVGFALLAAGEWVYRRIHVISAAGLFGAGVAVLFIVSYAGNVYYEAYSYQTAFAFALLTTFIGSAVAMRGRLVSVAVLAQIGGHLGPVVLSTGQPPRWPLLAYILMLQVVALVLAGWGRTAKWWALRAVSLVGTIWWVGVAVLHGHWRLGLGNEVLWFALLYAAAYQGELLWSTLRSRPSEGDPLPSGYGAIFSLLVTTGLTAVALHVFYDHDSAAGRGVATLLLAGLCLGGGLMLRPTGNPLVEALAASFQVQAVALLILFVPVTLTDIWISLAWGVLSLAFAALGARFNRGLARGAAATVWVLAILRLGADAAAAHAGGPAGEVWLTILGHSIRAFTVQGWLLALAGLVVAWLLQTSLAGQSRAAPLHWLPLAGFVSFAASLIWISVSLDGLPPLGGSMVLLVWAWLLVALDCTPQKLELAAHALAVLAFVGFKWILMDLMVQRVSTNWHALDYLPVFNPVLGVGVLIASSLALVPRLRRRTLDRLVERQQLPPLANLAVASTGVAIFLVTLGLSFEVDRLVEQAVVLGYDLTWPPSQVKLFGLTLLWLAVGLGLALSRRWLAFPALAPWLVLLIVAAKFLIVDMLGGRLDNHPGPAPATVLFNLQVLTAIALLGGLFCLHRLAPLTEISPSMASRLRQLTGVLGLLIALLAGTLEIDRVFASVWATGLNDPRMARNVAISLFWSVFALGVVLVGFRAGVPQLRYFGLALFGVTLWKVIGLDLADVRFGYRILSLLGLGLLLLATSVLYGKLGRRLRPGSQTTETEVTSQ